MRDRLIELLEKAAKEMDCPQMDEVADYLLANSVIVPPCKVGDRLYYCIDLGNIVHGRVLEIIVLRVEIQDKIRFFAKTVKHYRYNYTWFDSTDIGKTVFLTKEEAEKALAERSGE